MVLLASSAIDRRFEPWSGHTKDYKICVCCFSAKPAAIKRKSNDWLARNQNNVSEWNNISTRGLLFEWASTIQINQACWSRTKPTLSSFHWKLTCSRHDIAEKLLRWSLKINLFSPWYSWKIAEVISWKLTCSRHDIAEKLLSWR